MVEARHLSIVGTDAPEAEGRGPLPLFWWLYRRAESERCRVGQQEIADDFKVTVRTIYEWTEKLELAGCVRHERGARGAVGMYKLLLPLEEAAKAIARTSGQASTHHNSGFQSLPVGLPVTDDIRARDTIAAAAAPRSELPVPVSTLASNLTNTGLLLKLFTITDDSVIDRYGRLDPARQRRFLDRLQEPDVHHPARLASLVLDDLEADTYRPRMPEPEYVDAVQPAEEPTAHLDALPDDVLADRLTDAWLRGAS